MSSSHDSILERIRNGKRLDPFPIIDFHGHLGISSDFYYIPYSAPEQMVEHMDHLGVDHMLTFTIAVATDPEPGNRYQYEVVRRFPGRFTALTMLRGDQPSDWPAIIENGFQNGARGLKLICAYQGVRESGVDWAPAFDRIREGTSVVLNHDWESPERLRGWAERYPNIVFQIGHAYRGYEKVVAELPNVFMSTCAAFVTPAYASVTELWRSLPVEKILFGSDCQDLDFCLSLGSIAYAEAIPEADKLRILGGNALGLMDRMGWDTTALERFRS